MWHTFNVHTHITSNSYLTNETNHIHQPRPSSALLNWSSLPMCSHSIAVSIFKHLVLPWAVSLARVMLAFLLAIKSSLSLNHMTVLYLTSSKDISMTSLEQPLFLLLIFKALSTKQTASTQPCSSPTLSPNKAYHFLTSSSPFQTTESLHPSTKNLQMPIRLRRICSDEEDLSPKQTKCLFF